MRRTTEKPPAANEETRRKNDDLCKFLAEEYPEQIVWWSVASGRWSVVR